MTLLPVVDRELRVASRRGWTYWGRASVAAGAMLVIGWLMVTMGNRGDSAAMAKTSFATLSALSFGFTLLAGILFSADCFARERREGTLGLLFLTDLRSLDIALGKLAATSLDSVYCLMAVLPVLAIPLIIGGVSAGEYLRMVAALIATLWLALTTGLLASTLAQEARRAAGGAALLMLTMCFGVPSLGAVFHRVAGLLHFNGSVDGAVTAWTYWVSPFTVFVEAFDSGKGQRVEHYYHALIFVVTSGVLAFAWATFRLPRLWQDTPHRVPARTRAATTPNAVAAPGTFRAQLATQSPLVWLSNRSRARRWFPWVLLGALAGVWMLLWLVSGREWNDLPGWVATSLMVHFCLKMWLASEAPRVFHDERRSGGTELLLTTGLSTNDFIDGRIAAIRQLYVGPLAVASAVDLVLFLASFRESHTSSDEQLVYTFFWLGRMAMLWLDAAALSWTGTWISVATRGQRTTGPTWVRVVLLPYALFVVGCMAAIAGNTLRISPFHRLLELGDHVGISVLLILGMNFAVSGGWWAWAAAQLKREFRPRFAQALGTRRSA